MKFNLIVLIIGGGIGTYFLMKNVIQQQPTNPNTILISGILISVLVGGLIVGMIIQAIKMTKQKEGGTQK